MTDVISTAAGDLRLTFLGHGTLMFEQGGKVVHVDPWGEQGDYGRLPKGDLILVTHEHFDHLDPAAVAAASKAGTVVAANASAAAKLPGAIVLGNGDRRTLAGLPVEAVPAYNVVHMRSPGQPFHPMGVGNGYVIDFGGTRVYVAGDTENIPEMKALAGIDIAFLPMNLPYTMTPGMVADAAAAFRPKILYPYHYGETDPELLAPLLAGKGIEVRVRDLR
jgi:L-ascorbate metabolism protein UlaG (beta-lactamase superfamily)